MSAWSRRSEDSRGTGASAFTGARAPLYCTRAPAQGTCACALHTHYARARAPAHPATHTGLHGAGRAILARTDVADTWRVIVVVQKMANSISPEVFRDLLALQEARD